ncbi:hypothetical protein C0989_001953 [Termitomyces sp. Mn162]|nr:hypothetical protein C0989_001953 [Termitomyces sp. Mn162]
MKWVSPRKAKQGIKDLGNKDGHLLLTALQTSQLEIAKADSDKIKKDKITVIATAEPTTNDTSTVHSHAVFASGKTWVGQPAPKSAALTHVRHKKASTLTSTVEELPPAPTIKPAPPKKHVPSVETS